MRHGDESVCALFLQKTQLIPVLINRRITILNNEIKVSILCNAYNHEAYIRDALEGFVRQETNFRYEVLIHDDASTDKTADIIREYEAKYPEIIKPIYQTENQMSQGVKISVTYHYPRIKGKYIAFCEGDDYWTDTHKLQKQYDLMEAHPEADMCAHRAVSIDGKTGEPRGYQGPSAEDAVYTPRQVIKGEGGFVATASLFYRHEMLSQIPTFRKITPLDYAMQIHGSLRGGLLYLGEAMSVYRVCTPGSWTERTRKVYKRKKAVNQVIKRMLVQLNKDTKYKYWDAVLLMYAKALLRDVYCIYLKFKGGK